MRTRHLAVVALALTGCGGTTATVNQGQRLIAGSDADMVSFARCMRAHGVHMPDPFHRPGHAGLSISPPPKTSVTLPAYNTCSRFIKPIIAAKEAGARAQAAPQMLALTRYAQCMRTRGVPMLDPNPEGILNLGNVPGMSSGFGRYTPQFRRADTQCRRLLPASVSARDNGSGP